MDPIETWDNMVNDELTKAEAKGKPIDRGAAIRKLAIAHPEQHAAYLRASTEKSNRLRYRTIGRP